MTREEYRTAIIEEARSWIKTPWHHEGRVKGAGVDCGMLILEVYEKVGLIPHIEPIHYGPDFMLHSSNQWYVELILKFADEIYAPPFLPGDAIVFKYGRIFSHGGIVSDWPMIIHASAPDRCVLSGDASRPPLARRQMRIFRHKELF